MLTTNINIKDRLGTVIKIDINCINISTVLYIKFDDEQVGKTTINTSSNNLYLQEKIVLYQLKLFLENLKLDQVKLLRQKSREYSFLNPMLR
jgi:hypothetical protein